ncbi:hypothetical protein [Rhodococcus tibetensis]|uniref:Uncharacterized protein n=1 Tax=Rhodococcus tibetensis TaxID=2965064 RepID=A0ABT1QJF1_9NOCA|nr:hypothetical protein [Rhodococcus sp. FXJ9.536]MCQ4122381.1 hypothetical protein [Rhodococcus sp. FXJ9.536]
MVGPRIHAEWVQLDPTHCVLTIFAEERELIHLDYDPTSPALPPMSEASWPDEEDYDIGLFVNNIVNDAERQHVIFM